MSDTTEETVEASVEAPPDPVQEPPQDPQEDAEDGTGNKEAAKYRRRLRETETERDTLAERVTAMQRAEAERLAGSHLAKPAGLWAAGAELADLLDKDGNVDPAKVTEAAKSAMETLGLQRRRLGPYVPREGLSSGSGVTSSERSSSWAKAFVPNDRER